MIEERDNMRHGPPFFVDNSKSDLIFIQSTDQLGIFEIENSQIFGDKKLGFIVLLKWQWQEMAILKL